MSSALRSLSTRLAFSLVLAAIVLLVLFALILFGHAATPVFATL